MSVREHVCPPVAVIGSESVSAIGVTMSVSVCKRLCESDCECKSE
jgi:hypothetical protein